VRWTADAEQLILKVPRWRLESHLTDLVGHRVEDVIDFDFSFDLTTACGSSLLSAVEFLARELDRPGGVAEMPIAREQLETFVLTELLSAVPNPYTGELVRPADAVPRSRLKPVVEYMETNADEALTTQELARAGYPVVGTPEQVTEELGRLNAAGMDGMIMGFLDYNEEMKYFGEHVLPLMKQAGLRHD